MYAKNESGGRKVVESIDKGALTGRPYIPKVRAADSEPCPKSKPNSVG